MGSLNSKDLSVPPPTYLPILCLGAMVLEAVNIYLKKRQNLLKMTCHYNGHYREHAN